MVIYKIVLECAILCIFKYGLSELPYVNKCDEQKCSKCQKTWDPFKKFYKNKQKKVRFSANQFIQRQLHDIKMCLFSQTFFDDSSYQMNIL